MRPTGGMGVKEGRPENRAYHGAAPAGLFPAFTVNLSGVMTKTAALGADCDGWNFCQNHLLISTVRQTESIKPAGNLPYHKCA
jgi:hypothetical protein